MGCGGSTTKENKEVLKANTSNAKDNNDNKTNTNDNKAAKDTKSNDNANKENCNGDDQNKNQINNKLSDNEGNNNQGIIVAEDNKQDRVVEDSNENKAVDNQLGSTNNQDEEDPNMIGYDENDNIINLIKLLKDLIIRFGNILFISNMNFKKIMKLFIKIIFTKIQVMKKEFRLI